jgi:hypothetical protein
MDVVYLPDFEEQFVIRARTGLGRGDIETRLRNGWAAEVFSQQVDNSNLIPYVIRQVEAASEAAAKIATTWLPATMGLPPGTSLANLSSLLSPDQARQESDEGVRTLADRLLSEILVFKIAEVRWAQPGLYPILKPREIQQWFKSPGAVSGTDPEDTFDLFLEHAQVPWVRQDMVLIPAPPFTMIGFNTTTDVFLAPATERIPIHAGGGAGGGDVTNAAPATAEAQEKIRQALEAHREVLKTEGAEAGFGEKLNLSRASVATADFGRATALTATTALNTPLTEDEQDPEIFQGWIAAAFRDVPASAVTVTFPEPTEVRIQINRSLTVLAGLAR